MAIELELAVAFGTSPLGRYFGLAGMAVMLPGWIMPGLLCLGVWAVEVTRRRSHRPIGAIRRLAFRHRWWLARGLLFTALLLPLGRAFSSFKNAIPGMVPFYADPWLVRIDRFLFGTDPWRLTHAVIGDSGTIVLDRLYALWFVMMLLLLGWMCFTRNQRFQLHGLLAYLLSWAVLGNLAALVFASVGPCFYRTYFHSGEFDPLVQAVRRIGEGGQLFAPRVMDYLIRPNGAGELGAGISAMPSMHVAIAFLCFLAVSTYTQSRLARRIALAYALAIFVASVHLGWHYAADGLFSMIGVGAIWWVTGYFVTRLEARAAAQAQPDPAATPA